MKKFKFSLETLLKVRSHQVQALKHNLSLQTQAGRQVEQEKKGIEKELSATLKEMKEKRAQGQFTEAIVQDEWARLLREQLALIQKKREKMRQERALKQHELHKANNKKKLVTQLKEKKYLEFIQEERLEKF